MDSSSLLNAVSVFMKKDTLDLEDQLRDLNVVLNLFLVDNFRNDYCFLRTFWNDSLLELYSNLPNIIKRCKENEIEKSMINECEYVLWTLDKIDDVRSDFKRIPKVSLLPKFEDEMYQLLTYRAELCIDKIRLSVKMMNNSEKFDDLLYNLRKTKK